MLDISCYRKMKHLLELGHHFLHEQLTLILTYFIYMSCLFTFVLYPCLENNNAKEGKNTFKKTPYYA